MTNDKGLLRWAPMLAGAVLVVSLLSAGAGYLRDHAEQQAVEHDRAVIVTAERLLSALKDVEAGERGFIITGRDTYLEPYRSGVTALPDEKARLATLLGPDVAHLAELAEARVKDASDAIATYRTAGATAGAASIDSGAGKAAMDAVRVEVTRLQRAADERIATANASVRIDDTLRVGSVVGLLASCGLLAALAVLRRREQQASHRLLEGVMENAPIGLGILDRTLRIRHVNPALGKMSERALSAAPGMSIWDVIPQMRETLESRLQRVLQGGRPANADIEVASNMRADQMRAYEVSFYPLLQAAGTAPNGVGMVINDVTARKRAERGTRESEERFRSLVEANASIIWTTDAEGAFVRPQPAWMRFTGQTEAESLGWGRLVCLHPEDMDRTAAAWRDGKATGAAFSLENRLRRHDGAWRHMAVSIVPVREEDGRIREWIGSHTDITARKEAEQALSDAKEAAEAANRAKSAFLANMSHELRTPLSAVIGYSEMLEEEADEKGDDAALGDLGKIKSNAKHLLGLINDVLDLSKVEANKMDVSAETFAVEDFVRDAAGTVESLMARKNNVLRLDLAPDLGSMHTDAVKLRQCLFNLLSNAAKFTENGTITLIIRRTAGPQGDRVSFAVQDTGIGMTADQLARLFQRFTQADESTTRKFGGTGLGLALSRAFARLLGGDIAVESRVGVGTCFTVEIPATFDERGAAPQAAQPPSLSQISGTGDLVLVIDDDAAQQDLMARFIERQGFSVRAAADGPSGLELARTLHPRVILLDVMMPGMDGWAVLNALKAEPATADIPVVMVSFVADAGLGAALGAADSMPKPVDWERLTTVLNGFREAGGDVLVVDDDPDMRTRLRTTLEKAGWRVTEASNGAEALNRVLHAIPHMILLDLTMPVMDGFAFLHQLKLTPGCADIPVVVLTARDISGAERAQLSGADGILRKGDTSMRELTAALRRLEHPSGQPSGVLGG